MDPNQTMDAMGRTSIQTSEELADELWERKNRGESYEDVIWRLIELADAAEPESEADEKRARKSERKPTGNDDLRERAEAALDDLHVKGRDPAVERTRREAVMWAWDYLREREHARSSEIANATFGKFWSDKIGYSTSSRYPGYGLWDNCVRDLLSELPGVDAPAEKDNKWRFVEEGV